MGDRPSWYAVRCILMCAESKPWGPTNLRTGETAYEERITLWNVGSEDEAIRLAEAEASEHAESIEWEYAGLAQSFAMFAPPSHGGEVFSLIRTSELDRESYLDGFFDTGRERQRQ